MDRTNTKSVKFEADFVVGCGLYKNLPITGERGGTGSQKGIFDVFTPVADFTGVAFEKGTTRKYKVVFEVDNQGNWRFVDESTNTKRSGTFAKEKK